MKKIQLTLEEVLALNNEINGISLNNNQIILKGLINQKMNIVTKYYLSKLSKQLTEEKDIFENLRKDLIKKYADDSKSKDLKISKSFEKDGIETLNPNYEKFVNEILELSKQSKDYEIYDFKIDDFKDVETEETYNLFFDKIL